jgi:formate hydrogenlyase subunit 6/NADH:ubiquinone oxidoreductase subunit I
MEKLGFFEKIFLPDYKNIEQVRWGDIAFDNSKCTGCGICARACPADSIAVENKKAKLKPTDGSFNTKEGIGQCMSCGDCVAICPKGAIRITKPYKWTKYFKTIDRGELAGPRL